MDKKTRTILTAVAYNILFTNELAINALFEVLEMLANNTRYYRHAVKRWSAQCLKLMKEYNALLNKGTGGFIEFIAGLNDIYEDKIKFDLWKVGNTARNTLEKKHSLNPVLGAKAYVAITLLHGACHNVDSCMEGFPDMKNWSRQFRWMRITRMAIAFRHLYEELVKVKCISDDRDILDNEPSVMTGFTVLANKLSNADDILTTCNEYAVIYEEEHPEPNLN